jgi:SLT domain-containing protein
VNAVQYDPNGFNNGQAAFTTYMNQALDAMGITNPTARQNWINGYTVAAKRESTYQSGVSDGNPAGAPTESDGALDGAARGFLQMTPDAFAAFHQPGTSDNIYNPVANITASMNYVMARYGVQQDGSNLGIVQQFNPNFPAHGY